MEGKISLHQNRNCDISKQKRTKSELGRHTQIDICFNFPLAPVPAALTYPQKTSSRGGSRIFIWGGGAQKVLCQHAHYERGTELTFGRGPGPVSSRVILMLSRAI